MTDTVEQLGLTGKFFPERIPAVFKEHGGSPRKTWAVFELNYLDATMSVESERKKPALLPGRKVNGRYKSNNPAHWLTFDEAMVESLRLRQQAIEDGYEGRTFMPCYVVQMNEYFVDLDNHDNNEGVEKNHIKLIETLGMTYAEYSMSGAGQHIYMPHAWVMEGSVHKVVDEINMQMKKTGEFILLTGNVYSDYTQYPAMQPEDYTELLESYFKQASTPSTKLADEVVFEEYEDQGEEHDEEIIASLPEDSRWQLNNSLGEFNPHLVNGGSDGSQQLSRVVMDLMRACRNRAVCIRILNKSHVWQYENRKMDSHGKDSVKQYHRWRMVCAQSALNELIKKGWGKVVEFNLDTKKELGLADPVDISSHTFIRDIAQPAKAFFDTAPDNFKWFVSELMKAVDQSSQIYDYAIGAGLSILSGFAGKKYVAPVGVHMNYLCTNILLVGDSGIGKTNYTTLQRRIITQAKGESDLRRFKFTQPKASRAMAELLTNESILGNTFYYPEFGKQLANTFRTSNNNPDDLSATLMASSTERKYGAVVVGVLRANGDNSVKDIVNPCYSILGDTTVKLLKEHATSTDFNSGFLARFLIIPNNELTLDALYDVNPFAAHVTPKINPDVIKMLEAIAKPWSMFSEKEQEPYIMRPADEAYALETYKQIVALRIKYQHHEIKSAFFNRMQEYVFTIAALIELCKLETEPKISNQSIEWAFKYVTRCITAWCEQLDTQISTAKTSEDVLDGLMKVFYKLLSVYELPEEKGGGWEGVKKRYPQAVRTEALQPHHLAHHGLMPRFFKQEAKFIKQEGNFSAAGRVIDEHLSILVDMGFLTFEPVKNVRGKPSNLYMLTEAGLNYAASLM